MYNTALFDLDGTLTDPGEGITNSVIYALRTLGIDPPERRSLYKFIGPPLADSFRRYCGMNERETSEAVRLYRQYFSDRGIFENRIYPGIPQVLSRLKSSGIQLLVATSKPTIYAARILEHFALNGFFTEVIGSELDGRRTDKKEVISCALENCTGITVMVGDRLHDILGAKANGLDTIGVLYGYGSRKELIEAGATILAETPEDLIHMIL